MAQGSSQVFVQDVKAAPNPMCVLLSEWQLEDMVCFLTNNNQFGILTANTTYNLGDFYVTPMTYPHLMLQDVNTGKAPIMLGSVFVHQRVDFNSFNYFSSTLKCLLSEQLGTRHCPYMYLWFAHTSGHVHVHVYLQCRV